MASVSIVKLLELQERDSRRLTLEQQLKNVPREVAAVEARITAEKAAIEAAKAEWHGLESKKKLLEVDIKDAEGKKNIAGHEAKIRSLREREQQLQGELKAAQEAVAATRPEVPEPQLRIYDRVAIKPGHPVCVTVNGGKCGGCHLKVPTHIEVMAKTGSEIATCDQCGRIVYWQS